LDRGLALFFGTLLTFASAWFALVFAPFTQMNSLQASRPADATDTDPVYPQPLQGIAKQGVTVYKQNGCIYCHSQQVRTPGFGNDQGRGWGERRTVPRDYIYDRPHPLGTMRTGPDLANIGVRRGIGQEAWHHLHLYNPQITSPGSIMPPFAFLYTMRKIVGQPSAEALDATQVPVADWPEPDRSAWREFAAAETKWKQAKAEAEKENQPAPPPPTKPKMTYELMPSDEAKALVAYLVATRRDGKVPEVSD
jgi:cytochrome c oxidase cbb3-type subunit 2